MASYISLYAMSKSLRVSEEFHAMVKAHKRDDETMEEALRRLVGGPHPEDVAGILSDETAEEIRERLDDTDAADRERREALRERSG
jgi:hypothetical protein